MRVYLIMAALTAVAFAGTATAQPAAREWKLVWSDDFDKAGR